MSRGDFVVWDAAYTDGICVIKSADGISKGWQLSEGISRLDGWPADVFCAMDDEFPNDLELADSLYGAGPLVVSKQLREFLDDRVADKLEFLPVEIKNHKGRTASMDYYILNPLDVVDCIDIEKSGVHWNDIDPDVIATCEQLVIDVKRVPKVTEIFRPKFLPSAVVVRAKLAEALEKEDFTGLYFIPARKFKGI